jgi:glycosyltransferase involved in cell wall biosynthesis
VSQRPLVSICLPVFNGGRYLAQAIDAALAQTYKEFELIIRDDNSTDGSQRICQKYKQLDPRVRYRENVQRLGLFQNYNECIKAAKGSFIKLYAQDDLLEPDAIQKMMDVLNAHDEVALVTCSKRWIDAENNELERFSRFKQDENLPASLVIMANLVCLNNWIGEPSTAMFRARHAGSGFDTDFYHWGDIDYWFRILQNGNLYVLKDVLCSFRRHAESTTSSNLEGLYFIADIVRMWKFWHRYLEEIGENEEHFFRRASEKNAMHIAHLVNKAGLTVGKVREANPRKQQNISLETSADFREALFHAEQRVTSLLKELIETQNELEHRVGECKELRAAVEQMQNSVSWKLTSPIRFVRSKSK